MGSLGMILRTIPKLAVWTGPFSILPQIPISESFSESFSEFQLNCSAQKMILRMILRMIPKLGIAIELTSRISESFSEWVN